MRDCDRGVELVQFLLKVSIADRVEERSIEVSMEGSDDRAISFFDCHHRKDRTKRGVDVDYVVLAETENASQVLSQLQPPGKSGLRAVCIDRLALTDPDYMGLGPGAGNIRRDDVDVMSVAPRFSREEMNVLADAAKMRIVVLRNECDAERTRMLDPRHRQGSSGHQPRVRKPTSQ